jgi:TonB family protein
MKLPTCIALCLAIVSSQNVLANLIDQAASGECSCGQTRPNAEGVVHVGNVIGTVIRRVEPSYPEQAKRRRIEGVVVVEVFLDQAGCVRWAKAIAGPAELRASAEAAACSSRFTPPTIEGKPVSLFGLLTYTFKLPRKARAVKARPN